MAIFEHYPHVPTGHKNARKGVQTVRSAPSGHHKITKMLYFFSLFLSSLLIYSFTPKMAPL